jgi:hypothetical protein
LAVVSDKHAFFGGIVGLHFWRELRMSRLKSHRKG